LLPRVIREVSKGLHWPARDNLRASMRWHQQTQVRLSPEALTGFRSPCAARLAGVDSEPFLAFEHEAETDGDHQRDQDGGEEV